MKKARLVLVLLASVTTVSCTTLGGNIKGSFACRAPEGTCAPASAIDATAVQGMGATDASFEREPGGDPRMHFAGFGGGEPVRTNDRVLKIVFPAHTDGTGIYRDEAVARVVVEGGSWVRGPVIASAAPRGVAASPADPVQSAMAQTSGTPAALPAGAVAAPSGLREIAGSLTAAPVPQLDGGETLATELAAENVVAADADTPSAAALAAARAGHRIGRVGARPAAAVARPVAGPARRISASDEPTRRLNAASLAASRRVPPPVVQAEVRQRLAATSPLGGGVPMTDPIATAGPTIASREQEGTPQ